MILAYTDSNDCDFAVKFNDESKADKVQEAINAGIDAWYEAANEEIEANEYWSEEEIRAMYNDGYAEPTCELLDRWGIEYEIVDVKGEII